MDGWYGRPRLNKRWTANPRWLVQYVINLKLTNAHMRYPDKLSITRSWQPTYSRNALIKISSSPATRFVRKKKKKILSGINLQVPLATTNRIASNPCTLRNHTAFITLFLVVRILLRVFFFSDSRWVAGEVMTLRWAS